MPNSEKNLRQIRNGLLISISCQYLPMLTIGWSIPWLEKLPSPIGAFLSLIAFISFLWGYVCCWIFTCDYAKYKGYPKQLGLLGILNVLGLSILFLLTNKNSDSCPVSEKNSLSNFSISAILISYIAIPLVLIPIVFLGLIFIGDIEPKVVLDFLKNKNFMEILSIPLELFFAWYFFGEMKRAKVSFQHILGSLKKIDFKLPLSLAIADYFFAWGINSIILYSLTFIVPQYAESRINYQYATTTVGYIFWIIGALIFAPIMEELFFRGIIFQKLAISQTMVKGLIISAILFTIIHFRFDLIFLFISGITLGILYLKTNQLIVPILGHFFYNLIVVTRVIYREFFSPVDHSVTITIADYQQQFIDSLELKILFIVLSAPYIFYFIYKNFPRNYDLARLPYFANQQTSKNY